MCNTQTCNFFICFRAHTKQCDQVSHPTIQRVWQKGEKKCQQFVYSHPVLIWKEIEWATREKEWKRNTEHSWLDPKQTKPTKLKVNEAKNELTHNITFDNRNKTRSVSFSHSRTKQNKVKRDKTKIEETRMNWKQNDKIKVTDENWKVTLSFMALFKPLSNIL